MLNLNASAICKPEKELAEETRSIDTLAVNYDSTSGIETYVQGAGDQFHRK